ncbi:MAG TPA: PIN domain nuclease [Anaerolineaceae bacterium]|nr:PIN domain nuclease [Anaerolineaceae bacterium]
MTAVLLSRIIGLIIFALIGFFTGKPIHNYLATVWSQSAMFNPVITVIVTVVLFGLIGFIITPYISVKPVQALRRVFSKSEPQILISGIVGLIVGLVIAGLLSYPFSLLPKPVGQILPFFGVVLFGYLGALLFTLKNEEFSNFFKGVRSRKSSPAEIERKILVDTSTIIDGRIADIAKTGFLGGSLVVPRFVLNELQYVSDSADSLRRQRGRRGIDVLAELQADPSIPVTISDVDVDGVKEVDDRLVVLARQMQCPILTNDYNLNRVAEIQGVRVLNVNDLANAVKVVILPGESFKIRVIQEGKEFNQGVGYMDDGTMVVIENGQRYRDQEINVTVTKILQTSAGRMIFAKPD